MSPRLTHGWSWLGLLQPNMCFNTPTSLWQSASDDEYIYSLNTDKSHFHRIESSLQICVQAHSIFSQ